MGYLKYGGICYNNYTKNTKNTKNTFRTFIGRGSESGIVLMSLFIINGDDATFDNFIATDPGGGYKTALIK
jgi:hypothetical protein